MLSKFISTAALIASLAPGLRAYNYNLTDSYEGPDFFDGFTFFTVSCYSAEALPLKKMILMTAPGRRPNARLCKVELNRDY